MDLMRTDCYLLAKGMIFLIKNGRLFLLCSTPGLQERLFLMESISMCSGAIREIIRELV